MKSPMEQLLKQRNDELVEQFKELTRELHLQDKQIKSLEKRNDLLEKELELEQQENEENHNEYMTKLERLNVYLTLKEDEIQELRYQLSK